MLGLLLDWVAPFCATISIIPTVKLNLKMGNSTPHRSAQQAESKSDMAHPHPSITSLGWKVANDPHVYFDNDGQGDGENDDVTFNEDATPAESDDDDGMFHGQFYLGSEVLTEVEMQSPVEESKIVATPTRTPRMSNNSSCASSARELDSGSSQEQRDVTIPSFDGISVKQDGKSFLGEFTPLYKHEGKVFKSNEDMAMLPLLKESDRISDEESLQPSLESSQVGKQFSQSCILWNDRKCRGRVGSSSLACRMVNHSQERLNNGCDFRDRATGKYTDASEGEIRVGSLPDTSKSSICSRGWRKDSDSVRRARSLTDEDFNELRGCIDLGFVFTQDHIPHLCETLPALEVCYAIAHGPVSPDRNLEDSKSLSPGNPSISQWKVASPGDQPQRVKTRLRHWAQAVACNLRQAC